MVTYWKDIKIMNYTVRQRKRKYDMDWAHDKCSGGMSWGVCLHTCGTNSEPLKSDVL